MFNSLRLASLVALTGVAVVGVSSANANGPTALCKTDESPCGGANMISHLHETSKTSVRFLSSVMTIECKVLRLGDAVKNGEGNPLGNPLVVKFRTTYSNCNNSCEVSEVEEESSEYRYLRTGSNRAKVTVNETTHFHCSTIDCTVNGEGVEGEDLDPLISTEENGSDVFTEQKLNLVSGLFCPKAFFLDLTTTPLTKRYVST